MLQMTSARLFLPAVVLYCGLTILPAHGQTISDTAREIEAMVDFSGSVIVDGDVVESVDWIASDDECTYDVVLQGTTDANSVLTLPASVVPRSTRS